MLLLLSFIDPTSSSLVKTSFLEQHRDILAFIFKGLVQDPYPVVEKVFETCWTGLWLDPKIRRTLKVHLFNETIVSQVG